MRHWLYLALFLSLLAAGLATPARSADLPELQISSSPAGVELIWHAPADISLTRLNTPLWSTLERNGVSLPVQLVALELPADSNTLPLIKHLDGQPFRDRLPATAGAAASAPLPGEPLFVLYEGRMRGRLYRTLAFSPLVMQGGRIQQVTRLEAVIPGARLAGPPEPFDGRPFLAAADPPDPLAARPAIKLSVAAAGMQEVSAADLAGAGFDPAATDPALLRLWHAGATVPLEILSDQGFSGLRFYAARPGDRWNSSDSYWLTVADQPGPQISSRTVGAACAAPSASALQQGTWRDSRIYESRLPGPDHDYWYSRALQAEIPEPGVPAGPVSTTIAIDLQLPLGTGPAQLVLEGAALRVTLHRLELRMAGETLAAGWTAAGSFQRSFNFAVAADRLQLDLLPNPELDRIFVESLAYTLPAVLDLREQGAVFSARPAETCHLLSNLPPGATIYDLSDPANPIRLHGWGTTLADDRAGRTYLVSGPGTLHRPAVTVHTPVDLATPRGADAVYIAPAAFLPALEPLLAHRRAGGYQVEAIAVEAIYDGWSGGQHSPAAIRRFLRYAAASWQPAPRAVTLVGDGTTDPRNYLGYGTSTFIPPYLAHVDPFLGEVACENCYVQLDGGDPLDDLLPDMWPGRLPVKNPEELARVINKIIGYETDTQQRAWRSRLVYIADNADTAGNFPAAADESAARQPAGITIDRIYFEPVGTDDQPWRLRDPWTARERTLAAISDGAAIISYLGHGLYFQWAVTGPPLNAGLPTDRQYLLGLYDPDIATNPSRLPIVLSLTCLTGAFAQPSFSGTTIDERLLLAHGGAVAVWSSAGASVAPGQRALLRGFYDALWAAPLEQAPIGQLAMGGYITLFGSSPCCLDMLRTFLIFGDPLTPVRVVPGIHEVTMPMVTR